MTENNSLQGGNGQASPLPSGTTQTQQSAYDAAYAASPSTQAQPQVSQSYTPSGAPASAPTYGPVTEPQKQKAQKSSSGKTFLVAFAGALVACVLAFGLSTAVGFGPLASRVILGAPATSVEAADAEATLAEAVANKCLPSVASITVFAAGANSSGNPLYDYFNNGQSDGSEESEAGLGSGVVLSADGYVITNNHVVSGGSRYQVTIEGTNYEAEFVGSDASSDVAVLRVKDVTDLTPIEVADSDNIRIGEWVMSIGSPFGLEQSVATGIISATSRSQMMDTSQYGGSATGEVVIYPNLIQTDAAINPGNSGGALVNADGQLVGINTLITSYSGNYSGVGFAIPSNYAMSLAKDIISGKEPTHAQLGVNLSNVNAAIAQRYGFAEKQGAYVSGVSEGSSAAQAGIKVGDIIIGFNGKPVTSASDLMMDVRTKAPGDKVTITVNRDGQKMDFQVTLGSDEASQKAKAEAQRLQQEQQQQSPGFGYGYGNGNGNSGRSFSPQDLFDLFGGQ